MSISDIKKFIKLDFSKIITAIILIALFILGRRLIMQSAFPAENIFLKIDIIIFKPAEYIASLFNNSIFYYLGGIIYFIIDLAEYYLMACVLVFVFKKLKFKKQNKE